MTMIDYMKSILHLNDPTTIRVRVLREYGDAPSLDAICQLIDGYENDDFYVKPIPSVMKQIKTEEKSLKKPQPFVLGSTITDIMREVAEKFNFRYSDIIGDSRQKMIVNVRFLACALLHARGNSKLKIAQAIGRDRSTIVHAIATFPVIKAKYPEIDRVYCEYLTAWNIPTDA